MQNNSIFSTGILGAVLSFFSFGDAIAQDEESGVSTGIVEEILVTGIRSSIVEALEIKRTATNIVDSIVAEDIGKLPDQNIAEALQRLPGVAVNRSRGEGKSISVRGMDSSFNITTLNGRKLATENVGRDFSYDLLASELVSRIDINKSSQASLTEGGVGSVVNIRTFRPLDLGNQALRGSIESVHDDLSSENNPRASVLVSRTFADDTLGVLLSLNHSQRNLRQDKVSINGYQRDFDIDIGKDGSTDLEDTTIATFLNYESRQEERTRTGGTLAIQWQPSEDLNINWDTLYSKYDIDSELSLMYVDLRNPVWWETGTYTNAAVDSNNFVTGLEISSPVFIGLQNEFDPRISETYMSGVNVEWSYSDNLSFAGDVSYSNSQRQNTGERFKTSTETAVEYLTFDWSTGNLLPDVILDQPVGGAVIMPDSQFTVGSAWSDTGGTEVDDTALDIKFTGLWDTSEESSVLFGVSYVAQEKDLDVYASQHSDAFCCGRIGENWQPDDSEFMARIGEHRYIGVPQDLLVATSFDGYLGEEAGNMPRGWLDINLQGLQDYYQDLSPEAFAMLDPQFMPARSYDVEESVISGFAEIDISGVFRFSEIPYALNLGLRVSSTDQSSRGATAEVDYLFADNWGIPRYAVFGAPTNIDVDHDYTNVLPSLNLRVDPSDELRLRASAAKVISRAPLEDLRVANQLFLRWSNYIETGNPNLDPFEANQYDLTAEWYYSDEGALSVNAFYKDIGSFVVKTTADTVINTYEVKCVCWAPIDGFGSEYPQDITLGITQPFNDDDGGTIQGVELAWNQSFSGILPEPFDALGVSTNYTYLESETSQLDRNGNKLPFRGASKNSFNIITYYEKGDFGARLAYNWRDRYLSELATADSLDDELYVQDTGWLDASMYYHINNSTTLKLSGSNLTNAGYETSLGNAGNLKSVEYTGRQFALGISFGF